MIALLLNDFRIGIVPIVMMLACFRLMIGMVPMDLSKEIQAKNAAAGLVVLGIALCVGITIGLVFR